MLPDESDNQPNSLTTRGIELEHIPPAGHTQEDNSAIFLTYLSFLGDVEKTSAATNVVVPYIWQLAKKEGWQAKVDALIALKKEQGSDALAREINRVTNYVQAVRFRNVIDRVLRTVTKTDEDFDDFLTQHGKEVRNTSCKTVVELVKAAQIVHSMTYASLGDTCGERVSRDEDATVSSTLFASLAKKAGIAMSPTSSDPTASARAKLLEPPVPAT